MKKNRKLRPWVVYTLNILIIFIVLGTIGELYRNDMNQHIERVSEKCALQGYGIEANYTKEGDEYYVCKN